MRNRIVITALCLLFLLFSMPARAQLPIPARIGGTLTVNGTPITENTDTGYRIEVTRPDGSGFTPPAEDADGLTTSGWYIIDIPILNEDQPGGAEPGETAVIRVYKDGSPLEVTAPSGGTLTVGESGSTTRIDLTAAGGGTVDNHSPEARITGPSSPVNPGETVTLDGAASSDPDSGDTLTYTWSQTGGPAVQLSADGAQASFTAPDAGTLTFELRVRDDDGLTGTASVTIQVAAPAINRPPTAQAGADRTVQPGETVILDGTASSDPDGEITGFQWRQTGGTPLALSGADTNQARFTAPEPAGTISFELTVTDNGGLTGTDTVVITVTAPSPAGTPPNAVTGPDRMVDYGERVILNGANSSDPDGTIAAYRWQQVEGKVQVPLETPDAAQTAFVATNGEIGSQALVFALTVTDNQGLTDTDTVTINVTLPRDGEPPVARAGHTRVAAEGETVVLDGSNSADPDPGDWIARYEWKQISGVAVTLSDPNAPQPTFVAPEAGPEGKSLTFGLTVTDNHGLKGTDTVTVNVTFTNIPPVADAGAVQRVSQGEEVLLDASGSLDPDGSIVSFHWEQVSGPGVSLSAPDAPTAPFTAPELAQESGAIIFMLTVTDNGGLKDTDSVVINITGTNQPPDAVAVDIRSATEGETVTLDGNSASDPDGQIDTYLWQQIRGPSVTLSDPFSVSPTFVAPPVHADGETLLFQLTVTDNSGLHDTDEVQVEITDNGIDIFPQENIFSFRTAAGPPLGIRAAAGNLVRLESFHPDALENRPGPLPYGRIDAEIKVGKPGETSILVLYIPQPLSGADDWYRYDPASGWTLLNGEITANDQRDVFQIPLTDGGSADIDGIEDRIITASFAVAADDTSPVQEPQPSEDGGDGDTNNCFIKGAGSFGTGTGAISFFICCMLLFLFIVRRPI